LIDYKDLVFSFFVVNDIASYSPAFFDCVIVLTFDNKRFLLRFEVLDCIRAVFTCSTLLKTSFLLFVSSFKIAVVNLICYKMVSALILVMFVLLLVRI